MNAGTVVDMNDRSEAINLLSEAKRPVVFTGAGISVAAGLPTYRGTGGMWTNDKENEKRSKPPPDELTDETQRRVWWDEIWKLWGPLRAVVNKSGPTKAHQAIADWEQKIDELTVITQNVDGLHKASGSSAVLELHGSLWTTRCSDQECKQLPWVDRAERTKAPDCPSCGKAGRPDVVLFEETLNPDVYYQAYRTVEHTDLVVVIGTSGVVYPAVELLMVTSWDRVPMIRVDPGKWEGPDLNWSVEILESAETAVSSLLSQSL